MGTSVITIRVVGNHGCQRDVKDGENVKPDCGTCDMATTNCVDALARQFVERLGRGNSIVEANLHHWPEGGKQIVDELKPPYRRNGNF